MARSHCLCERLARSFSGMVSVIGAANRLLQFCDRTVKRRHRRPPSRKTLVYGKRQLSFRNLASTDPYLLNLIFAWRAVETPGH